MLANNPSSKQVLQAQSRTHQCMTRHNTPGILPKTTRPKIVPPFQANTQTQSAAPHVITNTQPEARMLIVPHLPAWKTKTVTTSMEPRCSTRLTAGDPHISVCNSRMISQEAINMLQMDDLQNNTEPFTTTKLAPPPTPLMNFEHYTIPMVHPTMGETISSYKQLMNNPITADTWQTEFGKDFVSMCQGDIKMGAKGMNAMFVMKPEEIDHMPAARLATYANIIVNYRPQKDNPYQIHITAGGNLINYPGELTTHTQVSRHPNFIGTASLARNKQNTCASTLRTFTFQCHSTGMNTCVSPLVCSLHG
jgi:hypothetical protein